MEEKQEFVQALIFNVIGIGPLDIYKRLDHCRILERLTGLRMNLPIDPYKPEFYREYLKVMALMESDRSIDYFGPDYGGEDVLRFDTETWSSILAIHKVTKEFVAKAAKVHLSWGDIDFSK